LLLELVLILIGQGVQPLDSSSDDGVGTLSVGSQLSLILLSHGLNHTLQDQVSYLEFPRLHVLVMCDPNLLLIGCDADLGLLSFRVIQQQAE